MKRLRLLAGLLGCLAVVAAGLPSVAHAWMPSASDSPAAATSTTNGTTTGTKISALCSQHCPECEGMPCPPSAAGCVVACIGTMPSLVTATVTLPIPDSRGAAWPDRFAALRGLVPPPDPSPPRS